MPDTQTPLTPMSFVPVLLEKVWGGRRLASLGKMLPKPDARYGESWEIADMSATSASGAGGGSFRSVICDGPLLGKTLHEAIAILGDALLPRRLLTPNAEFPLLIKFLDASEHLSVQVHPSPAYAAANPGAHLKSECWYVLDAAPGASVYIGLAPGVTPAAFAALCRAGDPGVAEAMRRLPAEPGTMFNLPSGTVHALGAGVLVAEVQTPSDTTYRLFDWGRRGREMHIEQGLASCLSDEPPEPRRLGDGETSAELVKTDDFTVTEHRILPGVATRLDGPCVLIGVEGQTSLGATAPVSRGRTLLVPAAMASVSLSATAPARVLHVRFGHRGPRD